MKTVLDYLRPGSEAYSGVSGSEGSEGSVLGDHVSGAEPGQSRGPEARFHSAECRVCRHPPGYMWPPLRAPLASPGLRLGTSQVDTDTRMVTLVSLKPIIFVEEQPSVMDYCFGFEYE